MKYWHRPNLGSTGASMVVPVEVTHIFIFFYSPFIKWFILLTIVSKSSVASDDVSILS